MWNKIFFQSAKKEKYAKYATAFVAAVSVFFLSGGKFTGYLLADDSIEPPTTQSIAQTADLILDNSIVRLQNSGNYAVDVRAQANIFGQTFNGKGIYRQKRQTAPTGKRIYSIRWEMEYFMEDFSGFTLQVLNGERGKLWRQSERRAVRPYQKNEFGDLETIDLNRVIQEVSANPENFWPLNAPWFSVFHVDQLLEGIRRCFVFNVAGETYYPGTRRALYQIQGVLNPDLALKIHNRKNPNEEKPQEDAAGDGLPRFFSLLSREVPTHVELYIDKDLNFPVYVIFSRLMELQNGDEDEKAANELRFAVSFENTYLDNAAFRPEEFEIMPENVTKDSTEIFIQSLKKPKEER